MEAHLLNNYEDREMINDIFPDEVRKRSTEFFVATDPFYGVCGAASLGFEEDTLIIQYLFVPEEYRRKGAATAIFDDISGRLSGLTDFFMEAYFDAGYGSDLARFFMSRPDFIVEDYGDYCTVHWLFVSKEDIGWKQDLTTPEVAATQG